MPIVNIGTVANDGRGDSIRVGGNKINEKLDTLTENIGSIVEGEFFDTLGFVPPAQFAEVSELAAADFVAPPEAVSVDGQPWVKQGSDPGHTGTVETVDGSFYVISSSYVRPEDFGWKGDGASYATERAAFFSYLNNVGGLAKITKGGQFVLDAAVTLTRSPQIIFENGAYLDASGLATSTTALTISGSQATSTALTGNALKGAMTIAVTSATGFVVNGTVRIASDAVYDPVRTASKIGELNVVVGVSGLNISLLYPLREDYLTSDSARAHPVTALENTVLDNAEILGDDTSSKVMALLKCEYAKSPILYGPRLRLGGDYGLRLQDCLGGTIYSPLTTQEQNVGNTGYGVSIMGAAQDVTIIGHQSYRARHAFTTNNSDVAGREGITRNITYTDFAVFYSALSGGGAGGDAVDTHAACDDITIRNGTIHGSSLQGVNIEGPNATVDNLKIEGTLSNGLKVSNYTARDGHYKLSRLKFDGIAGNLVEIRNRQDSATGRILSVDIDGLYGKRYTGKIINMPNTAAADTAVGYRNIHCDATASTDTVGQIFIETAASVDPGSNVVIDNIPATCPATRFSNVPVFLGSGNLGKMTYATGTNTSASVHRWLYGSNTTVVGPKFTANVTATGTNTAKTFDIDAETLGIQFAAANSNALTAVQVAAGGTYVADFETVTSATIASGVVTVRPTTRSLILTGEGNTTDTLLTINGMVSGQIMAVRSVTGSYTISVAEGGNLQLVGGTTFDLTSTRDVLLLYHNGVEIVMISSANNG